MSSDRPIRISRRDVFHMGATFGMLAGLGRLEWRAEAAPTDYKALVCLFLFGGNDSHNLLVPLDSTQYAAYTAARGGIGLPQSQLLPITDPTLGSFGVHYAMPEMQALFAQGRLAVLANVGVLVKPTAYTDLSNPGFPLPLNLRSHSDQVQEMQTGFTNSGNGTGWGGRTMDVMQGVYGYNAGSSFPVAIAMNSPALFCAGTTVQGVAIQPGNALDQNGWSAYPATASAGRKAAQQAIVTTASGNNLVDLANGSMASALALNPVLSQAGASTTWTKPFPSTALGDQLKEIANLIGLQAQLGVGRQVFFASLGGFDTHSGESYQQWYLLQQVSQALDAFYAATVQLGVSQQVTSFTLSDFGRTLQPSGSGSDHGWGAHHMILGGAVHGGSIYGRYPLMTNYASFNNSNDDYADNRGVMLPAVSLGQYGATLAKWFGAGDAQLNGLFPTLAPFSVRDLGFLT